MPSRLSSEDQQRVNEYLNAPQHRVERKPFRPWFLLLMTVGVVVLLGGLSRWLAALVPLVITVQFVLVGTGIVKDEAAVKAMSRTGDRREILLGPLFYGIVFVLVTVIYWKDSPVGIPALMMMCGGDGIADIVGRRIHSPKLPWSPEKSLAGSLSVFVGGWLLTMFIFAVYVGAGSFSGPITRFLLPVTWIGLGTMLVESLPFKDVDNITLTMASALIGHLVF